MIQSVIPIFFFVVILVMATLGSVLLVRFWFADSDRSTRIFLAAAASPVVILLPVVMMMLANDAANDGDLWLPGLVGFGAAYLAGAVIVGWPVSYFATKRLDRLTETDVDVFE